MEIKVQRKLTIAGPVFFLRRSLKEAGKCMAGFQATALMCMPGDKLHTPAGKGETDGVGGATQEMMELQLQSLGSIWKD